MNQKRVFLVPLLQLAAGLGWIGGTYAQPTWSLGSQILLQLLHYLPVTLLFLFGVRFLTDQGEGQKREGRTPQRYSSKNREQGNRSCGIHEMSTHY